MITKRNMKLFFEKFINLILALLFIAFLNISIKFYANYHGCNKMDTWVDMIRIGFSTDMVCNASIMSHNYLLNALFNIFFGNGFATYG